ncbi:MAG: hypothetical protein P8I97_00505 [Verrucomicrobiales bacterium]|nr:hypothetical protein [Verrucomicrobiales bacterium]
MHILTIIKSIAYQRLIGTALFVILLPTYSFAAITADEVEQAISPGAIYLDFVSEDSSYVSSTNPNISMVTNAVDWGWPDGSDNEVSVPSDEFGEGNIFDDKSNPSSDFTATVSGLTPGSIAEVFVLNVIKTNSYDFSWARGQSAMILEITEEGIGGDAPAIIEQEFNEESLTFSDRTHQHNGAAFDNEGNLSTSGTQIIDLPNYLVGGDYIRFANNARDNNPYSAFVEADGITTWYLLVDNRLDGAAGNKNSPNNTDPVLGGTLQWIIDDGWQRVNTNISPNGQADYTGVDEGGGGFGPGQGLNQFYSVYSLTSDSVTVNGQGIGGSNMISLVTQGKMITVNSIKEGGLPIVEDNGAGPDSYAISIGYFNADEDGSINVRIGKGIPNEQGSRTELDGLVIIPPADSEIPIQQFTATDEKIAPGQSVILKWIISPESTFANISPGNIDILAKTGADGKGSIELNPKLETEYTLTVNTPEEEAATDSVVVDVALIGYFTAEPLVIDSGEDTTLSWLVREDASISIPPINWVVPPDPEGTVSVSPETTTKYILTASAGGKIESAEVLINVLDSPSNGGNFAEPIEGWDYAFNGDVDPLSVEWSHDNGSDQWDSSDLDSGAPGGAAILNENGDNFLRLQDTGNPTNHGFGDPGSNRKVYFTKDLTTILSDNYSPLVDGITLNFRARVPVPDNILPFDDAHPAGGNISEWTASGDGYAIHDGGKGTFGIRDSLSGQLISFTLSTDPGPGSDYSEGIGLSMNRLNGENPSAEVDANDGSGETNLLPIEPLNWNDFWITIEADTSGSGTHRADIYMNGNSAPSSYFLTAGTGSDAGTTYMAMGLGATPQSGAVDIDFFNIKEGIHIPTNNIPFQIIDISYSDNGISISWPSRAGEAFLIEKSEDAIFWEEMDDSYPASEDSEVTEFLDEETTEFRNLLYRVSRATE